MHHFPRLTKHCGRKVPVEVGNNYITVTKEKPHTQILCLLLDIQELRVPNVTIEVPTEALVEWTEAVAGLRRLPVVVVTKEVSH